MIEIRELTEADMQQAMELKVLCWTEELAGKAENTLVVSEELSFWADWMKRSEENNDIRLLIGSFEGNKMLGVAFASFAEPCDISERGIELNGLWVYPEQRNKGISLMMVTHLLDFYIDKGMENMVIYNPHFAPSNDFYLKFGSELDRQVHQMNGKLPVDIFLVNMLTMKNKMEQSLKKYS
jgi:GNAT superfamily N-acetyltransferase